MKNHNKLPKSEAEAEQPGEEPHTTTTTQSGGTTGGILFEGSWQPQRQPACAGAAAAPLSPPSLTLPAPSSLTLPALSLSSQQLPQQEPSTSMQLQLQLQRSPAQVQLQRSPAKLSIAPPPQALGQLGNSPPNPVIVPAGIQVSNDATPSD